MRDFSRRSLLSFVKFFQLKRIWGIPESCTACVKWGVESFKAKSGGIFHSSPVLTANWVKNGYHFAWLVYLSGFISGIPSFSWDIDRLISWRWSSCLLFNSYVLLIPCRISHEQLFTSLFRAVELGATMYRGPFPFESRK